MKNGTVYWSQIFLRAGDSASAPPAWKTLPSWLQWLLRIFAFGWIWMK
ncbi:MAG: hypothetical protein FWC27_10490 [Firmicutes bacterium]|nr:hypothetical protein [Bacillota bacterium]